MMKPKEPSKEYEKAWEKWRRICEDDHYSKCLKCGKPGNGFSYDGDVEMVMCLVNDPKRSTPKVVCRHCGARKPWMDWRDYGLTRRELDHNLKTEWDKHEPWPKGLPLWAI